MLKHTVFGKPQITFITAKADARPSCTISDNIIVNFYSRHPEQFILIGTVLCGYFQTDITVEHKIVVYLYILSPVDIDASGTRVIFSIFIIGLVAICAYIVNNIARAKRGIRTALLIGMSCTAVLMTPLLLFARPLLTLFNRDPDVLYYGVMFVLYISPFYLFACVNDIIGGALRGAGEAMAAMICMLSTFVVSRQIYLFFISRVTDSPLLVGLGYPLGWVLCCISLLLCYRLIPWEQKQAQRQSGMVKTA